MYDGRWTMDEQLILDSVAFGNCVIDKTPKFCYFYAGHI